MYTHTYRHCTHFFSSGACHNRLTGHYSEDGACINHNTGSPVKQVSRGCWREHTAMAIAAATAAAARAMTNEFDTIVDTRKNKHVPKNMGKNNNPRINKYKASSWVWDSIFYQLIFFLVVREISSKLCTLYPCAVSHNFWARYFILWPRGYTNRYT